MRKPMLFILALAVLTGSAGAGSVSLAWDPSASPGVVGYKIYKGPGSGTYETPIVIGNQTSYTVRDLAGGRYYYFAVTAFDAAGNESVFSNEVFTLVAGGPAILTRSVAVNWYGVVLLTMTDRPARVVLRYQEIGIEGAPWSTIIASPVEIATEHRAVIYGLAPGPAPRYFRYTWSATAAGETTTADGTFFISGIE